MSDLFGPHRGRISIYFFFGDSNIVTGIKKDIHFKLKMKKKSVMITLLHNDEK